MVITPTRELAKQINETSIASDEQVVAMARARQADQSSKHCF